MSGLQPPLPPPPDEKMSDRGDICRLWVGNLDTRITEFTLLKLLQKYGSLDKFDFLYHKSGPDQGKPRGYCFVSYHSPEEASRAIQGLNGKLALSKKLIVRWAHADRAQEQVVMKHADGKLPVQCTAESKSSLR
ncbi:probable RNA-binding protein 18 [Liolophura sinensis]|uniref:probable RNA-binding protein 18 n=1 Tax=Liolophura sinensis TaxID=3198878 RepID=UPI003158E2FC